MYTKTGLGLLAAAGLTFGVIGMHAGGASTDNPACTSTSANGSSAAGSAGANASAGTGNDNGSGLPNGLPTPTTAPTQPGSGNGNGNGNGGFGGPSNEGLLSVDTSGLPGGGVGTVTVPDPTNGAVGGGSSGSDNTFLDANAGDTSTVLPGTATPPTNVHVVGRSSYLSRLLRLYVNASSHR